MPFIEILTAGLLTLTAAGEGEAMIVGSETPHSTALVGEMADSFYGLQLTRRGSNTCQVRAFFRGAVPRTAQYCRGRVTSRHVRGSETLVLAQGERVHGIAACLTRRGVVGGLQLQTEAGDTRTAQMARCETDFTAIRCESGWAIQGVQLFFDGPDDGRAHRRLMGVRALCSAMPAAD